jgi:hypothetical protein
LAAVAWPNEAPAQLDFDKAIAAIRESRKTKDLKSLMSIAEECQKEYPPMSYAGLRLRQEVCNALSSTNYNDATQYDTLQKLTTETAQASDAGALEQIVPIVQHLRVGFGIKYGVEVDEKLQQSRRANMRLYLRVFPRFAKEIIPDFDFKDVPSLNLSPPGGGYPSGVAPESIKEPEIRKQYEAALKANSDKADKLNRQRALRDLEKSYLRSLEGNVGGAYGWFPVNHDEVRSDFKEFGVPPDVTERVLKKLEERIANKLAQEEALRKAAEPPPFPTIAAGAAVDDEILTRDPRLQGKISINLKRPTVEDVLTLMNANTDLALTVADNIPRDRIVVSSVGFGNSRVYGVMDFLKRSVVVDGAWVKEEKGYRLTGALKPPLKLSVKRPPVVEMPVETPIVSEPAPQAPLAGRRFVIVVVAAGLLAMLGLGFWFWMRRAAPK